MNTETKVALKGVVTSLQTLAVGTIYLLGQQAVEEVVAAADRLNKALEKETTTPPAKKPLAKKPPKA